MNKAKILLSLGCVIFFQITAACQNVRPLEDFRPPALFPPRPAGEPALIEAIKGGSVKEVDALFKKYPDALTADAIQLLIYGKQDALIDWLLTVPRLDLRSVVTNYRLNKQRPSETLSLLSYAAITNYPYAVRKFLTLGTDFIEDSRALLGNPPPLLSGMPPLFWAVVSPQENTEIINLLIQHGADLYQEEMGPAHMNAAIHGLEWNGNIANIKALVQAGFDVTRPNSEGVSLIQVARERGRQDLLDLFSALSKAKKAGHREVVTSLSPQPLPGGVAGIVGQYGFGELTPQERAEMAREAQGSKKE